MNQPTPPNPYSDAVAATGEERSMAVIAHLSTLAAALLSAGWLSIVGPLVVWALYKDKSGFVRGAAAGAFNFNLVIWAITLVGWVLFFTIVGIPLAIIAWAVAFVASLYFHITAAVRANRGESYRYPWGITVLR